MPGDGGADRAESHRIFDAFADAGGNFVDTASNYTDGQSAALVGECIAADRDRFVVATKYSLTDRAGDPNFGGNHRKNLVGIPTPPRGSSLGPRPSPTSGAGQRPRSSRVRTARSIEASSAI